jgi:hypothetical protein
MLSLLIIGPLLFQASPQNQDGARRESRIPENGVLAQFQARKGGRGFFVVPVQVSARAFNAAIDTGTAYTAFDASLRPLLGALVSRTTFESGSGKVQAGLFRSPDIFVAGLPRLAPKDGVLAPDLTWLKRFTPPPVDLVLGMDVLNQFVVRIDGPRGEVAFLKDASTAVSKPVRLRWLHGTPWVLGMMGARNGAWFQLDTGWAYAEGGGYSGNLTRQGFARLARAGVLNVDGLAIGMNQAGASTVRTGWLTVPLRIGDYELPRATFTEGEYCSLGLRFLDRLITTFDFPNNVVYFDVPRARPDAAHAPELKTGQRKRR